MKLAFGIKMGAIAALIGGLLAVTAVRAQDDEPGYRKHYYETLKGKKIVFIAPLLGNDLETAYDKNFRKYAESLGMEYSSRDANFSTQAQSQAMEAMIGEKPDMLIVQSLTVQLLARQIKRAEEAGIPVIQLNMNSIQGSTALIGVDWMGMGMETADEMVKQCGKASGRSGKIAIIQGDITAADSFYQIKGVEKVFAEHPEMKIVANQSGQWDPNKARDIAATILQQNPDICAFYGLWGVMDMGVAQAIKEAGMTGKVFNYSNDGGSRYACDAVKDGGITKFWSYDAPRQAQNVILYSAYLLQNKYDPSQGTLKGVMYSPTHSFTKETVKESDCWDVMDQ